MASTQEVYVADLPQLGEILSGDFILVITSTGEYLLDFKNFIISEDNISFAQRLDDFDTSIVDLSATVLNFGDTLAPYSGNFDYLSAAIDTNTTDILTNSAAIIANAALAKADSNYLSAALVSTSAALVSYVQAVTAVSPFFATASYGITLSASNTISPAIAFTQHNINSVVLSYDSAAFLLTVTVIFSTANASNYYVATPTFTTTANPQSLNTTVKGVSSVKTTNSATFYVNFSANATGWLYFDALFI